MCRKPTPVADLAFHIDDRSAPGGRHVETLVETTNAAGMGRRRTDPSPSRALLVPGSDAVLVIEVASERAVRPMLPGELSDSPPATAFAQFEDENLTLSGRSDRFDATRCHGRPQAIAGDDEGRSKYVDRLLERNSFPPRMNKSPCRKGPGSATPPGSPTDLPPPQPRPIPPRTRPGPDQPQRHRQIVQLPSEPPSEKTSVHDWTRRAA